MFAKDPNVYEFKDFFFGRFVKPIFAKFVILCHAMTNITFCRRQNKYVQN